MSSLSRTSSRTTPADADAARLRHPSSRAATLTPSPKMSSPSTMMSPRWMPMRNSMRRSGGTPAFRSAIPRCTSTAQRTASTTLGNSTSSPSPVVLTMRPRCSAICGSTSSRRMALQGGERAFFVAPHQPRVARDICRQDRSQSALDPLFAHLLSARKEKAAQSRMELASARASGRGRSIKIASINGGPPVRPLACRAGD